VILNLTCHRQNHLDSTRFIVVRNFHKSCMESVAHETAAEGDSEKASSAQCNLKANDSNLKFVQIKKFFKSPKE
jgi:hypothetical protein